MSRREQGWGVKAGLAPWGVPGYRTHLSLIQPVKRAIDLDGQKVSLCI